MKILFFALLVTFGSSIGFSEDLQPPGSDQDSILDPSICSQVECASYLGASTKGQLTGAAHLGASGNIGTTKAELIPGADAVPTKPATQDSTTN